MTVQNQPQPDRRQAHLEPLLPTIAFQESLPEFTEPEEQLAYLSAHSIGHTIGQMLSTKFLAEANEAEKAGLRDEVLIDETTGLLNKRGFAEAYNNLKSIPNAKAIIAFMDLDHFKAINTKFGNIKVDGLLRTVGGVMQSSLRDLDIVASYGGDESALILQGVNPEQAAGVIQRLQAAVGEITGTDQIDLKGDRLQLSVGITEYDPEASMETVLDAAAEQLLLAKKAESGKGQIFFEGQPITPSQPEPALV